MQAQAKESEKIYYIVKMYFFIIFVNITRNAALNIAVSYNLQFLNYTWGFLYDTKRQTVDYRSDNLLDCFKLFMF